MKTLQEYDLEIKPTKNVKKKDAEKIYKEETPIGEEIYYILVTTDS
jgi:hypothetical protein